MCGSHGQRTPERRYEWTAHLAEQVVLADAVPVVDLDLERALGERRQLGRDLHVKERVIKLGVEVVVHDLGLSDRLVVEVDLAVRVGERERVGALEVLAVLHLDHVELVVVEVLGLADLEPDALIFLKRHDLPRRTAHKRTALRKLAEYNLDQYCNESYNGTNTQLVLQGNATYSPLPGHKHFTNTRYHLRTSWTHRPHPSSN